MRFPSSGKSTAVAMGEEPGAALNLRINPTCRMMRQVAMGEEPGAALNRMYCTQIQLQFRIVKKGCQVRGMGRSGSP